MVWIWLVRLLALADSLAEVNCGMTIAARIPRITTTIRISTRVKPRGRPRRNVVFIVAVSWTNRSRPLVSASTDAETDLRAAREGGLADAPLTEELTI